MTEFEYLAVLVSVILGLGMTHLLRGFGRQIRHRHTQTLDPIHLLWALALFLVTILNWWVFFQSQSLTNWTFDVFLMVVLWSVVFYLMAIVLFPPDVGPDQSYGQVFSSNLRWFLGFWIASSVFDIALTSLRGDLLDPPFYLPFVLHFVVLGMIGIVVKSRRYHLFLASYVLLVSLIWALLARRML